jgi:outer membrane biosynthesis protein TonB
MRKLILLSALLLATAASAQAGETRSLSLSGAGVTEPAKPIAQVSMQLAQAATAPIETTAPAPAATAEPKAEPKPEAKTTETKPAKPVKKVRRESDERKARRIAAKYGVYW